jgi:flagellar biosynthesis protein FliR
VTFSLDILPELAALFVLTFARIGAMVMLMPGYGEQFVPRRLRLVLALSLALLMMPLVRDSFGQLPRDIGPLLLLLGAEVMTGLAIGLCVRLVTGTMATAGTVIAQQIGLGFVTQVDPTQGGQSVLLANFLTLLGIMAVFAFDLHHLALAAVHDSYRLFRPGEAAPVGDFARLALQTFAGSFALAMQIAAPFLVVGTVFQVALGVLSRLMPQLQIMFIAMPAQLAGGFLLVAALLATMLGWYGGHVRMALERFMVP